MKTKTINIYQFDELDESAKERARNWYRQASSDDGFYYDCVIDDAVGVGILFGLDMCQRRNNNGQYGPSVYFSGFSSQGNGACFEAKWRASNVQNKPLPFEDQELQRIHAEYQRIAALFPDAVFTVKHRGHYYHENCTEFDIYLGEEAEDALIECSRDLMRWIYRSLEREYDYHNSDDMVDENIRINEYDFTEDGDIDRPGGAGSF